MAWGRLNSTFSWVDRVPCLLVKEQIRRDQVDRIFQFFGRRLVGMDQAFGVGFKIHLDFTLAHDIAGARIIFKIRAVDLIEAAGIAPVQRDGDVMQLDPSAFLVLHRLAGLNLEYGVLPSEWE